MNAQNKVSAEEVDQIVDLVADLNSKVRLDKDLAYLSDEQHDRLADGINDLTINIYNHKLVCKKSTERMDKLTEMMTSMSALDFSKTADVTDNENHLDYMATGLNLMNHQLKTSVRELQLYKRIFESMGDLIVVTNQQGVIKFVNEQAGLLGDYNRQQLIGKQFEELINLSDGQSVLNYADILENFEFNAEHQIPFENVSIELTNSDDDSFSVNMAVSVLRDDQDEPEGFVFAIPGLGS